MGGGVQQQSAPPPTPPPEYPLGCTHRSRSANHPHSRLCTTTGGVSWARHHCGTSHVSTVPTSRAARSTEDHPPSRCTPPNSNATDGPRPLSSPTPPPLPPSRPLLVPGDCNRARRDDPGSAPASPAAPSRGATGPARAVEGGQPVGRVTTAHSASVTAQHSVLASCTTGASLVHCRRWAARYAVYRSQGHGEVAGAHGSGTRGGGGGKARPHGL
jgi:hypothetical protein